MTKITTTGTSGVKCALAMLVLTLSGSIIAAPASPSSKMLTSFCGFKPGEKRPAKEPTRARKSFRKFREIRQLLYTEDGKLNGVCASAFLDKMNGAAAKMELNLCCKELEKQGISFVEDWVEDGNKLTRKGCGSFVSVSIYAELETTRQLPSGKMAKGASADIELVWSCVDLKPYSLKPGKYIDKDGKSRREFLEDAFGFKFDEKIPEAKITSWKNLAELNTYTTRLATPFLGMVMVELHYFGDSKSLKSMELRRSYNLKLDDAKKEHANLCDQVKKWLAIETFEPGLSPFGNSPEIYCEVAKFSDGNISVKITTMWEKRAKQATLTISAQLPKNKTQAKQRRGL